MSPPLDLDRVRKVASTPPIFVAGSVRSGTTLVRSVLDAHPAISITYETGLATDLCLSRSAAQLPISSVVDRMMEHPAYRFVDVPFDRATVKQMLLEMEPADSVELVRLVLALRAVSHDKSRFGDKTPRYVFHLQALHRLFPDAQLVLVVRDGRQAAASGARLSSESGPPRSILLDALLWRAAARRSVEASRALRPSVLCTVRLEDIRAEEESVFKRLCEFVGEQFDPVILDHNADARDRLPLSDSEFANLHSGVARPVEARAPDWKVGVSSADARATEVVLRSSLQNLSYPVGPAPTVRQSAEGWARVTAVVARELPSHTQSIVNHARREVAQTLQRVHR